MPLTLIIFILAALVAVGAYFTKQAANREGINDRAAVVTMWVAGAFALLAFIGSIFVVVPTKEEGVVTSFGSPQGTLDNGLHLKLPWEKVTDFDAAVQTDESDIGVRMANQYTATIPDTTVRWRIVPDSADDLYKDYRDFGNVRSSLVTTQVKQAMNEVFGTYDPLGSLNSNGDPQQGYTMAQLGQKVQDTLSAKIGDQIEVLDVLTPKPDFDPQTENVINQYQQALAATRIAAQRRETAEQEAAANRELAASVSNDPNVLVSKCLDAIKMMIDKGQAIPAGFSCWPGGGSALVLPATPGAR